MSVTEYLWLEERVKISESVPRERTEWAAWPGKCFYHKNDMEEKIKEFIQDIQGSILPTEEKVISRLEDILCCCGNRPNQKAIVARIYGYTAGINLPQYAHEDRQSHLIEHFHNMFNHLTSEQITGGSVDTTPDFRMKIIKFLDEVLEAHRYRTYNPSVVRLLHIINQYLEKPLVQYIELPLSDFVRLIEGPLWEECAEKLRTRFCSNIYVDFNSELIDAGNIGIYVEGPSVYELKAVKSNLTTYIDKTINPPKDEEKNGATDHKSEKKEGRDNKTEEIATEKQEGKETEDIRQKESSKKMEGRDKNHTDQNATNESFVHNTRSLEKETTNTVLNDKKRDSRSVDRSLQPTEGANKDMKEAFIRSKSVPAISTTGIHESHTRKSKRAKHDSECSDEDILQSNSVQELTLFKETLSLVLVKRLEDNNNSLVNV